MIHRIDNNTPSFLPGPWTVESGSATLVSNYWRTTGDLVFKRDANEFAISNCTSNYYTDAEVATQWYLMLFVLFTRPTGLALPESEIKIELLDAGGSAVVTATARQVNVPGPVHPLLARLIHQL